MLFAWACVLQGDIIAMCIDSIMYVHNNNRVNKLLLGWTVYIDFSSTYLSFYITISCNIR